MAHWGAGRSARAARRCTCAALRATARSGPPTRRAAKEDDWRSGWPRLHSHRCMPLACAPCGSQSQQICAVTPDLGKTLEENAHAQTPCVGQCLLTAHFRLCQSAYNTCLWQCSPPPHCQHCAASPDKPSLNCICVTPTVTYARSSGARRCPRLACLESSTPGMRGTI